MKLRVALATATLGAVALIGLTACGSLSAAAGVNSGTTGSGTISAAGTSLSPEASALSTLGFSTNDVTTAAVPVADPSQSTGPGKAPRAQIRHRVLRALTIRRSLAKNVQHGEVVVKTKNGDKTIDVQRGTVTAINSTTATVRSADGFTETWTFGSPIHVIDRRNSVQPSAVTTGTTVGIAGTRSGSTPTATLMVIAQK